MCNPSHISDSFPKFYFPMQRLSVPVGNGCAHHLKQVLCFRTDSSYSRSKQYLALLRFIWLVVYSILLCIQNIRPVPLVSRAIWKGKLLRTYIDRKYKFFSNNLLNSCQILDDCSNLFYFFWLLVQCLRQISDTYVQGLGKYKELIQLFGR